MKLLKFRNSLAALCCAFLLASPIQGFAEPQSNTAGEQTISRAVEEDVQAKADNKTADRRKKIMQDAVEALEATNDALAALDEERIEDALESLAVATGKLELLVARDPDLALAPTSVAVSTYDIYGSSSAIKSAIAEASDALKSGDVQAARKLLSGLRSETVISVTNIPLATYPAAIKAITPLIDEGKVEAAKRDLQAALSTLVVVNHSVPLPVLRAAGLLEQAENLAEKSDRSDEENAQLADHLSAARTQLKIAELLGYTSEAESRELYDQLDEIANRTRDGASGEGFFDTIENSLTDLWDSVSG